VPGIFLLERPPPSRQRYLNIARRVGRGHKEHHPPVLRRLKSTVKLLALAEKLFGSREKLQAGLKCSPTDLESWAKGTAELPMPEYHHLIGLIIFEQNAHIRKNRDLLDQMKKPR
jgi:hypothetical protein